jgi:hypothetical protein
MKYKEIRPLLKTGDLILFRGKGFISNLIQLVTLSEWSHVGLVLTLREYDFVVLWESTTLSTEKDLKTKKLRKGVQLCQLSSKLANYRGSFAVKRLNIPVEWAEHKLVDLRLRLNNRDYERSYNELFKAAYDWWGGKNKEDLSSVFCSELVVEAYKELGLLGDVQSNEYTPADLGRLTKLKGGYYLSAPIYFDYV